MSFDLSVYLECSRLPTIEEWAAAISREGFPLTFPESVDLPSHTGYLPAVLKDVETGFELLVRVLDPSEELPEMPGNQTLPADADVYFCCHGIDECLAASIAAAVLANMTDGMYDDPQRGEAFSGREAVARARRELDTATKKGTLQTRTGRGHAQQKPWWRFW
jgi:hypothetical protein